MPRILLACLALVPAGLAAQEPHVFQDARPPRQGEVWIELFPAILNWSDRFALDSPDPSISDGSREPLAADFEGPILSRIFPAIDDELLASLNADAGALGYDPLGVEDLSVGALDFSTVNVQVRRALASVRVGILDRVAVELGAPIVFTEVEPLFAYDTAAASVARAAAVLPDAEDFLSGMDDARSTLQDRVEAGTLSPEEEAAARALLEDSGAFVEALRSRVEADRFLPVGASAPGAQMAARFTSLSDGFAAFDLALPAFGLRDRPGTAALQALFTGDPLNGPLPGTVRRSFDVGEVEAGVAVGILDTFGDSDRRVRLRTSAGAKLRIPIREPDAPPFADRADPFARPIGDGQRDLELSVHQDAWLGSRLRLGAAGRVGIQAADELLVRVHPPDRPFALPGTEAAVRRDLGDYVQLRLSPQFLLNDVMALGLEYGFWRKGADAYRLLQDVPGVADAGPLELETRETRHRLGIGVFYRPGEGRRPRGEEGERPEEDRDDPLPWRLGLVLQWSVAGSGGQTPASQLLMATFRIPFRP